MKESYFFAQLTQESRFYCWKKVKYQDNDLKLS